MPPRSCCTPGMNPGTSTRVTNGNIEHVAEPDKPGGFVRRIDIQRAGFHEGIVGNDSSGDALYSCEPDDDIAREGLWTSRKSPLSTKRVITFKTSRGSLELSGPGC